MTEQKVKKSSSIAKKLRKGILSPCYKSTKVKHNASDKHDLDNIDNGTLSFDKKYLKKKHSDISSINTTLSRPTNPKTESPLSEVTEAESYLKRKPQNKGKEKVDEVTEATEIIDVNSSDSEDDVPLSQISKVKQNPGDITTITNTSLKVPKPNAIRQESVESKESFYTANNGIINTAKKDDVIAAIKAEENSKKPSISMPVPTGSSTNLTGSISIPAKMEPTKSEMGSQVDAKIANQSIPMPVPTNSTKINASEEEPTYIVEEIVTEEVINGKKRITTQTITRRANPQKSPLKNQASFKMPEAVGSKMEEIKIPAKMTPTRTETTTATEGIVDMPMNLPKPSVSNIDTGVPNLVDSQLDSAHSTAISEIVDEDRPNAIPMPTVPEVIPMTNEPQEEAKFTENVVSSPVLMADEKPSVPDGIALESHPSVEPGFNVSVQPSQPQPVEAGFNFSAPPVQTEVQQPVEAGFNFRFTDEQNMPLPMPIPGHSGSENMGLSNSPPAVPNLLALSSANKKEDLKDGYLSIPQPLPPSAIEDNQVLDDDRSDVSHGSKKVIVSSPKVLTVDEEIKFSTQLADKERQEHEEALMNEKPITNMPMPKTPSTYFKNNNLSDNEGSDEITREGTTMPKTPSTYFKNNNLSDSEGASNEPVKVEAPAALPSVVAVQPPLGTQKMKLAVVNQDDPESDSDSDSSDSSSISSKSSTSSSESDSDDEKLISVKKQYEEKKKELEARIGNLQGNIIDTKEDIKEDLKDVKEEVKEDLKDVKEEVKEEIKDVKEEIKEEIKEEVPAVPVTKEEVKEEIKEQVPVEVKEEIKEQVPVKVKEEIPATVEQVKEEVVEQIKDDNKKEEVVTEITTTTIDDHHEPVTETEVIVTENVPHPGYASSEASFNTYLSSTKKSNRPKSIKSFFGFSKKDKKDKKANKHNEEAIPEFPEENLSVNTALKSKKGSVKSESKSPFSFKRFVSPFSSKRRNSNASLKLKGNKQSEKSELSESSSSTIPDVQLKTEIINNTQDKPLPVPAVRPTTPGDMNKVIADVKAQGANKKFVIPEDALERVELENKKELKKDKDDDKSSIHSVSSVSSSASSASSVSSASSASSKSSVSSKSSKSSASSSDEEVLGNIANKKQTESQTAPIPIETKKPANQVDFNRNYTQVENDDFVSLMMVQRMLSSSVDRSSSLDAPVSPTTIPEMPANMVNPFAVDVEAERRKSYSKPKAIVTAVNPRSRDDPVGTPRSTILYKFDEKPKLESKNNFYRNDFASRSVGSLPIAVAVNEEVTNKSSPKQRMVELNLDNSVLIQDKENAEADNRKSTLLDSNLMQMFDDIHNLSLDDITSRYTSPSMIQCDIGPSFLDEVMGSLSMDKH